MTAEDLNAIANKLGKMGVTDVAIFAFTPDDKMHTLVKITHAKAIDDIIASLFEGIAGEWGRKATKSFLVESVEFGNSMYKVRQKSKENMKGRGK